jgi:hypothetical protein
MASPDGLPLDDLSDSFGQTGKRRNPSKTDMHPSWGLSQGRRAG